MQYEDDNIIEERVVDPEEILEDLVNMLTFHKSKCHDRFDNTESWSDDYGAGMMAGLDLAIKIIEEY